MIYDCAIIGAGLSGLASSIVLSKNGLKTALIERSHKTCPLVSGFRRKCHYFDTGFHHAGGIGEGSSGRLMLDYLGVSRHLKMLSLKKDYFDTVRFKDSSFEFCFPTGYESIREGLSRAFPQDMNLIDKYLDEIKKQCLLLPFLNLDSDMKAVNIFEMINGASLDEFLSGYTGNRYLKAVLSVHCLLNGVPSREQGLNNYAYIVGPYYESVSYIEGGGSSLATAYEKTAVENGVDIFLEKEAEKILFSSSGDITGIAFRDGSEIGCRKIISTIHPLQVLGLVPGSRFRPSYVNRIKRLNETPSAFILYGISETDLSSLFGSGLYLMPASGYDFGDGGKPLEERPANVLITDRGKEEDDSGKGFIIICPASIKEVEPWESSTRGNRPKEYLAFKEKVKERMLDCFVSFYPELKNKLHAVECSTPLTLRDYSGSPYGSMYGAKHMVEQYNPFPMTSVQGLYLAGQSIVAPGLLGTLISAFLACGNILGHDFLRGELRRWN